MKNLIRLKPQKDTQSALNQFRSIGGDLEFLKYDAITHEMIFVNYGASALNSDVVRHWRRARM